MQTRYVLTVFLLTIFLLFGCGSDSDNSPPSPYRSISGQVIDGPIEGAYVYLYQYGTSSPLSICGASGEDLCRSRATDSEGSFSLTIASSFDLSNLYLKTWKGKDTDTARDFSNIPLEYPLARLLENTGNLIVSPFTTLVNALRSDGMTLSEAVRITANSLALTEAELFQDPRSSLATHRLTQTLSATAQRLVEEDGTAPPLELLASFLPTDIMVTPTGFNSAVLSGLSHLTQTEISLLYARLTTSNSPEYTVQVDALSSALTRALRNETPTSETYNTATYISATETVAATLLAANAYEPVPLGGILPTRLALYVAATYNSGTIDLSTASGYNTALPGFSDRLVELANDAEIATLCAVTSRYAIAGYLPLYALQGENNDRRIDYYLNSDISFLHQGIETVQDTGDVNITDAIYLAKAVNLSKFGLFTEAISTTKNILTPAIQAQAKLKIGEAFIDYGEVQIGKDYLKLAEEQYKALISALGPENLTQNDAKDLWWVLKGYQSAGDLTAAQNINLYLEELALQITDPAVYGRIIIGAVGVGGIFESYLAEGDTTSAAELATWAYDLAKATPTNGTSYQLRVYNLSLVLNRFSELFATTTVESIFTNDILPLLADQSTLDSAIIYFGNLSPGQSIAEALTNVGLITQTRDLASLIDSSTKSSTVRQSYKNAVLEYVVTSTAVNISYDAALAELETISDVNKQIEALTFRNNNIWSNAPRTAAALYLAGNTIDASLATYNAIDKIDRLVPSSTSDTSKWLNVIKYGYAQTANLLATFGDTAGFSASLEKAATVADTITSTQSFAYAVADNIAREYANANDASNCETMILHTLDTLSAKTSGAYTDANAYAITLDRGLEFGLDSAVAPYLPDALTVARSISATNDIINDQTNINKEVERLTALAEEAYYLASPAAANDILSESLALAVELYDETKKTTRISKIVLAYAELGFFGEAIDAASQLTYLNDRNAALLSIAENLQSRDSFPDTWVADIDTDGDGMPNFFHPLATQTDIDESGLVLDDDSDNDGIPDTLDRRPLYPDI